MRPVGERQLGRLRQPQRLVGELAVELLEPQPDRLAEGEPGAAVEGERRQRPAVRGQRQGQLVEGAAGAEGGIVDHRVALAERVEPEGGVDPRRGQRVGDLRAQAEALQAAEVALQPAAVDGQIDGLALAGGQRARRRA